MKIGSAAFGHSRVCQRRLSEQGACTVFGLPWRHRTDGPNIRFLSRPMSPDESLGRLVGGCNFVRDGGGWRAGWRRRTRRSFSTSRCSRCSRSVFSGCGGRAVGPRDRGVAEVGAGRPFLRMRAYHGALPKRVLRPSRYQTGAMRAVGPKTAPRTATMRATGIIGTSELQRYVAPAQTIPARRGDPTPMWKVAGAGGGADGYLMRSRLDSRSRDIQVQSAFASLKNRQYDKGRVSTVAGGQ